MSRDNVITLHRAVAVRRDPDDIARQHGCEAQGESWPYDESECVEDMLGDAPTWTEIAVVTAAVVGLVLFVMALNEGWLF